MYTLRILIVILSITVYPISTMLAQINVYTQGCNSITNSQYNNGSSFNAGCYELPSSNGQMYSTSTQKEVVAEDHILLENDVEFTATAGGQVDLRIEELPYDVVAFTSDLDNIKKLDKFEVGLNLPEFYNNAVENFINKSGTPRINPFLSDQIEIIAEFSTEVELSGFTFPITKKRHGYFTTDITRDISGFEDLYNDSLWQSADVYYGSDYENLGGGWTETFSEFPFRIRFAPPNVGEWTCVITVNILNGTTIYETPPFTFNVIDSNIPDYLKVGKNGRWLKRDGMTYVPQGVNYPFVVRNGYPLLPKDGVNSSLINEPQYYRETTPIAAYEQYLRYMDTLAQNGVNYFRMIMNPWSLDIEYETLGDYSERMHIAKEMDLIIERAQNNGMLIHWNLMVHYGLQTNPFYITAWDWSFDPAPNDNNNIPTNGYCYNDELGLSSPIEFFSDSEAIEYYKERIRYIVARWGYSPTVGMFEHLSEINQVGTEHDANAAGIPGTNLYNGNNANKQIISDWHGEMSYYMKEVLKTEQLLTLSYTTTAKDDDGNIIAGLDTENDASFWHGNIDVISVNNYNYDNSEVHNYYKNTIPHKVADEQGNTTGVNFWGNYNKPVIFSESGAHEVWGCDNFVETRRNIWQNMFYGIAATFDWEVEYMREDLKDFSIYGRVKDFMDGVDLEGGNWHSGIVKKKNDGTLEYRPSYLDDCIRDDQTADLVYLRSGDQEKAIGVITNRRANYFTLGEGDCTQNTSDFPMPTIEDLQTYDEVSPDGGADRLMIRNMKSSFGLKKYKIKYYSPFDLTNPLKEEIGLGAQFKLEFPNMDSLYIVLFEVFPVNENFKSTSNDTTSTREYTAQNTSTDDQETVLVYPNPNNGNFIVRIEDFRKVKSIEVLDQMGRTLNIRSDILKENKYFTTNLSSGSYWIKIVFTDRTIHKKIVIH